MKTAFALALLVACSSTPTPPPKEPDNKVVVKDTRTPLEQRRDAACEHIAPKLTKCAVDDAKADFEAGKTSKSQFDSDTAPEVQHKNTEVFITKCKGWKDMSSRQVRVLEVCDHEESECGPLTECLKNLEPKK